MIGEASKPSNIGVEFFRFSSRRLSLGIEARFMLVIGVAVVDRLTKPTKARDKSVLEVVRTFVQQN
jgi:hypothetical protein